MKLGSNTLTLGEAKGNPYSLDTMRRAAQILHQKNGAPIPEINANALYVRFYPSDAKQFNYLLEESGLELFNYPLDQPIVKTGANFHDLELPSWALYPWLYTTIYPHQKGLLKALLEKYPKLKMEILSPCFIPMSTPSDTQFAYDRALEKEAIRLVPPYFSPNPEYEVTKEVAEPKNRCPQISFVDNQSGKVLPVKGIKVRANYYVKWMSGYTNAGGGIDFSLSFPIEPSYSILFQNECQFSIYQGIDLISPIQLVLGNGIWETSKYCISSDNPMWTAAVINDAAYDYFMHCRHEGMTPPPSFLKLWHWTRFGELSSAPMLRHLTGYIHYQSGFNLVHILEFALKGFGVNFALFSLGDLSPDILIGRCRANSSVIYNSVAHELAHASHFAHVGSSYWKSYISFILSHRQLYGTEKSKGSGRCAIGEMWGYSVGNLMERNKYGLSHFSGAGLWFDPMRLQKLIASGMLSKSEVLRALTPEVISIESFRSKLIDLYPDRKDVIIDFFG